ncbi:MAG: OmpA family protein [Aestuariibacter sp.]
MQHARKITLISCLTAMLFMQQQVSANTCFDDGSSCSLAGKWYAGLEFGDAETQMADTLESRFFDRTGIAQNDVSIRDDDHSKSLLFGYHFTDNLAVEASYRDLGSRSVTYSGPNANRSAFESNAGAIFPETGSGLSLGAIASWPLSPRWKLSGKLGIMRWESDTQESDGVIVGRQASDGSNLWYGVETSYLLTPRIQSYLGFTRFNLDRDEVDLLGVGVRVFFGGEDKPRQQPKKAKAETVARAAAPVVPAEGDADGDGVTDSKDACPDTPKNHMVDNKGCTRYKPINYEHELTIYYPNNSADINQSYLQDIAELVDFAQEHDIKIIKIIGHTSKPGTDEYNQGLSERRAKSLQAILLDKYGYSGNQIITEGRGETDLAVQGDTETAHSKNRRLEVKLSASGRVPLTKW